ncbi:hypothetical protein HMPREF0454_00453 [Hafnia alvei ATCC 51873]|uniref:Uncharacterized protein n=1 Tax=Hafnia alvei ATCC 51873 TaxID=1002364 RepID=G9Y1N6_HAFAL|nr:hypothetical protein HMPREF0454_00453 [Hafnia alvei ATCC 51873]
MIDTFKVSFVFINILDNKMADTYAELTSAVVSYRTLIRSVELVNRYTRYFR